MTNATQLGYNEDPALVTLELADGTIVGPVSVHGSGGAIPRSARRGAIERLIEQATEGHPLPGVYEPSPGHVSVYRRRAAGSEERRGVDLRGARLVAWE